MASPSTTGKGDVAERHFLTIPEAAKLAGWSLRHFRRIIVRDHIPVMKIRRKMFIVESVFQAWLVKHQQGKR